MSLPPQPPDRGFSVRRAWMRLAVVHAALALVLLAASYARLVPSTIDAVTTAQFALIGLWVAMGSGRALLRFAVAVSTLVLLQQSIMYASGLRAVSPYTILFVLLNIVFQVSIVAVPTGFLRNRGWRLVDKSERIAAARGSPLQFRVSHLLGLTTFVAGLLVLRKLVQSTGTFEADGRLGLPSDSAILLFSMVVNIGGTFLLLALAVVTGFWACLGPHPPGYRLTLSAFLVALLCAIPFHVSGGSAHVGWAGYIGVLWAIVVGSLLLLRRWGVRLVSSKTLRDVFPEEAETQW